MKIGTDICGTGIILRNLSQRSQIATIQNAHKGKVSGLCFAGADRLLSCGVDRNIKMWDASANDQDSEGAGPSVRIFHRMKGRS